MRPLLGRGDPPGHAAQTLDEGEEQRLRHLFAVEEAGAELAAGNPQVAERSFLRAHRGAPRPAVDQRQLADQLVGAELRHLAFNGAARPRPEDRHRGEPLEEHEQVARVRRALRAQERGWRDRLFAREPRQLLEVVRLELGEERHAPQELHPVDHRQGVEAHRLGARRARRWRVSPPQTTGP